MSQIDIDRADTLVGDYDMLMELIRTRTSVRKLKPDPIPDDCVTKVLEAGRWAMSNKSLSSPRRRGPSTPQHCRGYSIPAFAGMTPENGRRNEAVPPHRNLL